MKKFRKNLTIDERTLKFLESRNNASEYLEALIDYARAFSLPETTEGLREEIVRRAREREPR